ncbi:hypothetical protein AgCh_034063 [Apium graveolens]
MSARSLSSGGESGGGYTVLAPKTSQSTLTPVAQKAVPRACIKSSTKRRSREVKRLSCAHLVTTRKSRIDIASKTSVVFGADVKDVLDISFEQPMSFDFINISVLVKVCDKMAEEKKQPVFRKVAEFRPGTYGLNLTSFILKFLAEWGDRSQIATIANKDVTEAIQKVVVAYDCKVVEGVDAIYIR